MLIQPLRLPTKRTFWKQGVSPCRAEAEGSPKEPTHQKGIFGSIGGRKSFKWGGVRYNEIARGNCTSRFNRMGNKRQPINYGR